MVGDAFKALGDPTRRRILELLSEGEMSAGDIAAHFDMAKPSVSHHLCGAPLLLWLPAGCCAHPLGRGRPNQRLGAKIHCADYGSPARPDADFDGSAAPH